MTSDQGKWAQASHSRARRTIRQCESQIRGLLLDRGFAIAKSITRARRTIGEALANFDNELTPLAREALLEL